MPGGSYLGHGVSQDRPPSQTLELHLLPARGKVLHPVCAACDTHTHTHTHTHTERAQKIDMYGERRGYHHDTCQPAGYALPILLVDGRAVLVLIDPVAEEVRGREARAVGLGQ